MFEYLPDASIDPLVAQNSKVLGSNPGRVECLSSRLYIYNALNCSNASSVQCYLWYRALMRTLGVI